MAPPRTVTPVLEPIPETLAAATERLLELVSWTSIRTGAPPSDGSRWITCADITNAESVQRIVKDRARGEEYGRPGVPELVIGNYLFRDFVHAPLQLAGYLWARERRVPVLAGNVAVQDSGWIQHFRWLEPRAIVLPGDPLAGDDVAAVVADERSLDDALFDEVRRFAEPILEAFRVHRYVAPANAWGSILDSLGYGVQLAGRRDAELGLDAAWERWDAAIEGRTFPARRRPRRLQYEWAPGCTEEALVRAGCCLWYMTEAAKKDDGTTDYCTTCYLKPDEERLGILIEWKRKEAAREAGH